MSSHIEGVLSAVADTFPHQLQPDRVAGKAAHIATAVFADEIAIFPEDGRYEDVVEMQAGMVWGDDVTVEGALVNVHSLEPAIVRGVKAIVVVTVDGRSQACGIKYGYIQHIGRRRRGLPELVCQHRR